MSLKEVRKKIDLIDSNILKLLNDRMELVLMSKKFKPQIEDKEREKELLDSVKENLTGLINDKFIEKIYTEIIKEGKKLQQKEYELIAFQGEHGAYCEVASREWNNDLIPVPCSEFAGVFEGVESGLYDYGIVPVENTLGGSVDQVNRLLINTDLNVVGAVELPISLYYREPTTGKYIPYTLTPRRLRKQGTFFQGINLSPLNIMILRVLQKCWRRKGQKYLPQLRASFVQSFIIWKLSKRI
jgi:chorismate mutase